MASTPAKHNFSTLRVQPVEFPSSTQDTTRQMTATRPNSLLVVARFLIKAIRKVAAAMRLFCNILSGGYFHRMEKKLSDLNRSLNESKKMIGRFHDDQQESILQEYRQQNLKGQ